MKIERQQRVFPITDKSSSIVEALETFQSVVLNGLDEATIPW